jgi:hypothetical protein
MSSHLLHITITEDPGRARDFQRPDPMAWASRVPSVGESLVLEIGSAIEFDVTKVMWHETGGAWIWLVPNPRTELLAARADYVKHGYQDLGARPA